MKNTIIADTGTIIADTGFFVALANVKDNFHQRDFHAYRWKNHNPFENLLENCC